MTVSELIEELRKYPSNESVYVTDNQKYLYMISHLEKNHFDETLIVTRVKFMEPDNDRK